jgi:hypothetical protein
MQHRELHTETYVLVCTFYLLRRQRLNFHKIDVQSWIFLHCYASTAQWLGECSTMLRYMYIPYRFIYPAIYIKKMIKVTKGIRRNTPYVRRYWNAKFPDAIVLSVTVQSSAFRSVFLVTFSIFSDRQDRMLTNGTLATKIPKPCKCRHNLLCLIAAMICNLHRSVQNNTRNTIYEGPGVA